MPHARSGCHCISICEFIRKLEHVKELQTDADYAGQSANKGRNEAIFMCKLIDNRFKEARHRQGTYSESLAGEHEKQRERDEATADVAAL